MAIKDKSDGKITFGFYVVGLIDVLNQQEHLLRMEELPKTHEERTRFIEAAKESVGAVSAFRDAFRGFFRAFANCDWEARRDPRFQSLSPSQRAEFRRLMELRVGQQCFSDTTVLFSPLAIGDEDTTVFGVLGMILATGVTLLSALANGVAIRGGIDVGVGTEYWDGEVYGPALARAHDLEQSVARYPRIMLGKTAMEFMRDCVSSEDAAPAAHLNKAVASMCLSAIWVDDDGAPIVDFLGDAFKVTCPEAVEYSALGRQALAFARGEHERFVSIGDSKHALRYFRLCRYLAARLERES